MKNNQGQKQVSLAGAAKKKTIGKKIIGNLSVKAVVWLSIVAVVVLSVAGSALYKQLTKGPSLSAREMVQYTVTPDAMSGKVAYFALGVTGEEATDRMDMVAVMCLDRKKDTAHVLQLPVATYLGSNTGFAAAVVGDVWGNPQPVTWCETCRQAVVSAQEVQSDKHAVCGTKLTTRPGSSFNDLCRVFNEQYGLPIDNYLVIPRAGLVQLVDAVGGVDLKLEKKATLNGTSYDAGVQLLSGEAAVAYATQYGYNGTPSADRGRLLRQRALFAALLERLARYKVGDMYYIDKSTGSTKGIIGQLMNSANPVRFDTSSFGKSRLADSAEGVSDGLKFSKALAEFVHEISHLGAENITCSILPGETAKHGATTVYTVNRAQTIELLNQQMNPYGLTLDAKTVKVPQLKENPIKADATTAGLDTVAVSQGTTTTTTTAAGG